MYQNLHDKCHIWGLPMQLMDIIDKVFLFILGFTLYLQLLGIDQLFTLLLVVLIALIASALLAYTDKKIFHHTIIGSYILFCLFLPSAIFFLPVIIYTWFFSYSHWLGLIIVLLLSTVYPQYGLGILLILIAFILLTALLKYRTKTYATKAKAFRELEDRTRELTYTLKQQHQQLLESQDSEIYHATLNERHRIAREIHDHVGHVLSRALLQIGAILALNQNASLHEHLQTLRETLNQGMDNIRSSVHDLHDTSIDIEEAILKITSEFSFCTLDVDLHIINAPSQTIKYAIIAIIKEALNNIIKHSNASQATLRVREHHAFYQLVLSDNGYVSTYDIDEGIGLKNINERVEKLGGRLTIDIKNGFKLFITLPREEIHDYD